LALKFYLFSLSHLHKHGLKTLMLRLFIFDHFYSPFKDYPKTTQQFVLFFMQ